MLCSFRLAYTQWAKSYGEDSGWYEVLAAHPTADGGVIILGDINYHQNIQGDSYILKLLPSGDIDWARTYNRLWYLTPTYEGGYIAVGESCLVKLNIDGYIEWAQKLQSLDFSFVQQTSDNGYIACGSRYRNEERASFFIKFDEFGDIEWKKKFAIGDRQGPEVIKETTDGGYIACGNTGFTKNGTIRPWIMKITSLGKIEWQKKLEGDLDYAVFDIALTSQGDYIVVGGTDVNNLDDTHKDGWAMKVNAFGEIIWQKLYIGVETDQVRSVIEAQEGGYILAGLTISNDCWDILILRLSTDGDISWKRAIGDRQEGIEHLNEIGSVVCQLTDGGFVVVGDTNNLGFVPDASANFLHTHVLALMLAEDDDYYACKFNREPHIATSTSDFRLEELTFSLKGFGIGVGEIEVSVLDLHLNTNDVCNWEGVPGKNGNQKSKKSGVRR
jgi:hypothetical protein